MNKVFITGGSGLLGRYLCNFLIKKNYTVFALRNKHSIDVNGVNEYEIDLNNLDKVHDFFSNILPETTIHCAGYTNVDECENNKERAFFLHKEFPANLANLCSNSNSKFIYLSTDQLWNGTTSFAREDQKTDPINIYAKSKSEGEEAVLKVNDNSLIIRTNFFGKGSVWRQSFTDWIIHKLINKEIINAFQDVYFTPISLYYLTKYIHELIVKDARGIYHLAGSERISKYNFALKLADYLQLSSRNINPISINDSGLLAPRALDMSLSTEKINNFVKTKMPDINASFSTINK
jgi:dTDP-4-dehydrorhamnose reductase